MLMAQRITTVLFLVVFSPICIAETEYIVRHVPNEDVVDVRKSYFVDMLDLALSKSENKFGPYKRVKTQLPMFQSRAFASLVAGNHIDVAWMATTIEREESMLPIRIPLMKGLMGYRVMIINSEKSHLFAKVKERSDLANFVALQGHDWPDTLILRHNDIKVRPVDSYLGLFDLVDQNRYDYIPRSMLEAWAEVDQMSTKDLMVDPHILFVYPYPVYFFVSKNNKLLAERLEYGLMQAIKDGSFEKLLRGHPAHRDAFEKLAIDQRKIFHLDNPYLPDNAPLDNPAYWYQITDLVN